MLLCLLSQGLPLTLAGALGSLNPLPPATGDNHPLSLALGPVGVLDLCLDNRGALDGVAEGSEVRITLVELEYSHSQAVDLPTRLQ